MSFWNQVIAKNSEQYKEYLHGQLLVLNNKNIDKISFKYAIITPRKYTTTISILPGEFLEPTETIYTTEITLPFSKGGQIILSDKSIMTIKDIEVSINQNNGNIRAFIIYLDGGVANEFD